MDTGESGVVYVQVDVTAASGTTPTLTVVIEGSNDGTNWFQLGVARRERLQPRHDRARPHQLHRRRHGARRLPGDAVRPPPLGDRRHHPVVHLLRRRRDQLSSAAIRPRRGREPMARSNRMYVAIETFACRVGDEDRLVVKDKTRVREDDPVLKGNEEHFRELDDYPEVEAATAAPGERRGGRRAAAAA
jgi:hypothetical protein